MSTPSTMSPRRARSLPLLVLASVVLLEHLSPVHTLAPILSGKQRRYLRAEAGRLEASKQLRRVQVMEVARSAAELSAVLEAKEMARCKFMSAAKKSDAKILAQEMSELTDSTVAQVIGHTALFYKPSAKRLYTLPKGEAGEPVGGPVGASGQDTLLLEEEDEEDCR